MSAVADVMTLAKKQNNRKPHYVLQLPEDDLYMSKHVILGGHLLLLLLFTYNNVIQ
jgi:hypothetical protein